MTHVEAVPVGISFFGIFLLIALIGLVVLILANRSARRALAGVVTGVAVICVFAVLALVVMRTGVRHSTSSPSLSLPSSYHYPPEDEAMESHTVPGVTVDSNGVVVRESNRSIVVNGNGVSVTDGSQSINVSGNGIEIEENRGDNRSRSSAAEVRASKPLVEPVPSATPPGPVAPVSPAPAVRPGEAAAPGSATDEWIDAGQADFEADVYPSERSAAVALARQAIRSWDRVLPDGQEPTKVLISGDSELEPAVVPAVLKAIRAKLGNDRVEVDKSPQEVHVEAVEPVLSTPGSAPALPEAGATLRLVIGGTFSYSDGGGSVVTSQNSGGTIEVVLSGPAGKSTHTAPFVNKPWVEHGIDRASQVPGQQRMVARSKRLCPTRSEAEQQAVAEAAKNLVPLVRTALERLHADSYNQTILQAGSDPQLTEGIVAQMRIGTGVEDQFTQRLRKSYGDVWQHALLVDASDRQITAYAQTFLPQIIQQQKTALRLRESWARTIVGLALLTVLIAVVYAFLNAATRGYYTWLLRGSMVLLVLAGAVLMLLMT